MLPCAYVLLLVRLYGAVLAVLLRGRVELGRGEGNHGVGVVVRLDGDPGGADALRPPAWKEQNQPSREENARRKNN